MCARRDCKHLCFFVRFYTDTRSLRKYNKLRKQLFTIISCAFRMLVLALDDCAQAHPKPFKKLVLRLYSRIFVWWQRRQSVVFLVAFCDMSNTVLCEAACAPRIFLKPVVFLFLRISFLSVRDSCSANFKTPRFRIVRLCCSGDERFII